MCVVIDLHDRTRVVYVPYIRAKTHDISIRVKENRGHRPLERDQQQTRLGKKPIYAWIVRQLFELGLRQKTIDPRTSALSVNPSDQQKNPKIGP